jgi:hypothetical protein
MTSTNGCCWPKRSTGSILIKRWASCSHTQASQHILCALGLGAYCSRGFTILGIESFQGYPPDSKTIDPLLQQVKENLDYTPNAVVYNRGGGGRGKSEMIGVKIRIPNKPLKQDSLCWRNLK